MRNVQTLRAALMGALLVAPLCGQVVQLDTIRGQAQTLITYAIPDFSGTYGNQIATVVRDDLERHGAFMAAQISPADSRTLDQADRSSGQIHFRNWANLGAQVLGQGEVRGAGELSVEFALYRTANGQRIFGKRYSGPAGSLRRVGHLIADDIVYALLKEKGYFASRLLYVQTAGASRNVYICDSDGANAQALTSGTSLNVFPDWFPDGKSVLFTSYHEGRPIIYRTYLGGGRTSTLLAQPGMNACGAVSPDGRKLAAIVDKDGHPELYVFGVGSSSGKRLTQNRSAESSPTWSPDSGQIAYASDETKARPQIYIISAGGGTPRKLTTESFSRYCTSPAWSPDGKKLAFVAHIGGNFEICMYDFGSRQVYQLTNDPSNDEHPSWARDSRHLAFSRGGFGGTRLMLLDSETGKVTPLVTSGSASMAAWEP